MFTQNDIECRGPLYPADHFSISTAYFSSTAFFLSIFFPRFRERFLPDAPPAKRRALVRVHYLCFSVLRASLNTRCAQYPESRVSLRRPDLAFHISLQSLLQLLDTRFHEKGRTLVRNSYSEYATGRREFTSAGGPVDGSRVAKLFNSNYYWPSSNDVGV